MADGGIVCFARCLDVTSWMSSAQIDPKRELMFCLIHHISGLALNVCKTDFNQAHVGCASILVGTN